MKKIISLFLVFASFRLAVAQNQSFTGFLPTVSFTGFISKKVDYNLFGSTTIDAFNKKMGGVEFPAKDFQLYIQPSIIYKFSPSINVAVSYTFQRFYSLSALNYSNEHRIWEQLIFGRSFSKFRVTNRLRFEQRFIENKADETYPFFTRLRYQLGCNFPIQGKTLDKGEFYFNAYNEFYFSLTGAKNATYSANWSYAGVGYLFGKMGKIELGYLLQANVRDIQKDLLVLNLCQVSWISNFNFRNRGK